MRLLLVPGKAMTLMDISAAIMIRFRKSCLAPAVATAALRQSPTLSPLSVQAADANILSAPSTPATGEVP